jgi:hypothetical protein
MTKVETAYAVRQAQCVALIGDRTHGKEANTFKISGKRTAFNREAGSIRKAGG